MSVAAPQRFTKRSPCPICGGGDDLPRGTGRRCSGFLSSDGLYAHCTREEHAGALEPTTTAEPRTFAHRLEGECHCGREHSPAPLNGQGDQRRIAATFDYVDESGRPLFQVVRFEPKGFQQRRPDGAGGWVWKLGDTRRVLYRLPIVLGAIKLGAPIYVVEGEKDVHAIEDAGAVATCNPMGAGKWRREFSDSLAAASSVRVVADRDEEGRRHAEQVTTSLREAGIADVAILEAAVGKDATDHLAAGRTLDEFVPLTPAVVTAADPTVTIAEFVASPDEQARGALIEAEQGTIQPAGGLGILAAKASDGKTTFTVDLVLHAAAGLDYLGLRFPEPLAVLVVENEGPREAFREKLEERLKHWPHDATRVRVWDEPAEWGLIRVSDEQKRNRLRDVIAIHAIDLVVSDSLTRFGMRGNGTPEETRDFVELLADVGLGRTVSFLLLHHPRTRSDPGETELERLAGAWQPHADLIVLLQKLAGNRARLSYPKARWARGQRPPSILSFDPTTEGFGYIGDDEPDERDYIAELVDALTDGDWRTITTLRQPKSKGGIGAREDAIAAALTNDRFEQADGSAIGKRKGATYYRLRNPHGGTVGVVGVPLLGSEEEEPPRPTTRKGGGGGGGSSDPWGTDA